MTVEKNTSNAVVTWRLEVEEHIGGGVGGEAGSTGRDAGKPPVAPEMSVLGENSTLPSPTKKCEQRLLG